MSDIGLTWNTITGAADFSISANDLAADPGLETAVMLSIYLDAPAQQGDVLPDGETDRRGWWADAFPFEEGDVYGSRLWLLSRAKRTNETLDRAKEYVTEALQWMIAGRVADSVEVSAEWVDVEFLGISVTINRPELDAVTYRFNYTWVAQEGRR